MQVKRFKHWYIQYKIMFIMVVSIFVMMLGLFCYLLPFFEHKIMKEKMDAICHQIEAAMVVVEQYDAYAKAGMLLE